MGFKVDDQDECFDGSVPSTRGVPEPTETWADQFERYFKAQAQDSESGLVVGLLAVVLLMLLINIWKREGSNQVVGSTQDTLSLEEIRQRQQESYAKNLEMVGDLPDSDSSSDEEGDKDKTD